MWVNTTLETAFVQWFNLESVPSVVFLNPAEGKLRYMVHEGELT